MASKKRRAPIEVKAGPGGEVFAAASPDAQVIAVGLHELANCVELVSQEIATNELNVTISLDHHTQTALADFTTAVERIADKE